MVGTCTFESNLLADLPPIVVSRTSPVEKQFVTKHAVITVRESPEVRHKVTTCSGARYRRRMPKALRNK